ncbi:putative cytosolic sulfotransferase 12-like protein [Tanacetum coccineum]|uniref:Cytosolic sulfotransferase 12-like protein n=1 Tax=Tanacetum coccineum TaxID=301880 RepID=A0ABQ4WJH1_9ASTR
MESIVNFLVIQGAQKDNNIRVVEVRWKDSKTTFRRSVMNLNLVIFDRWEKDVVPDNIAAINPVHRGEGGESSFSVAGPVSGLITYSGPIAFSGSISLRSDSSTTSTRSFAFPILQNEWNSSPVRMAKADRRRLQKHRGWRHTHKAYTGHS